MTTWIDQDLAEQPEQANGLLLAAMGRGGEYVCTPQHFASTWDLVSAAVLSFGPAPLPAAPPSPVCGPDEQVRILMARVDSLRAAEDARTVTSVRVEPKPEARGLSVVTAESWLPDQLDDVPVLRGLGIQALRQRRGADDVVLMRGGRLLFCGEGALAAFVEGRWHRVAGAIPAPNVQRLAPCDVRAGLDPPPLVRVGGGGDLCVIEHIDSVVVPSTRTGLDDLIDVLDPAGPAS